MKDLRESPQDFHIMLGNGPIVDGATTVHFSLGKSLGNVIVVASEARTIAAWFAGLATELEASEET